MSRLALALAALAVTLAPLTAAADDAPAAPTPKRPPPRAVPDFDGREPPPATAVDVLAWVPRVLLFPARLVADYGVRRPVGYVVSRAEHSKRFRRVMRQLFREIEDANPLIYPVALVDFGFQSSIGARVVFRRGMLLPKSDVTFRVGTGGLDFWRAHVGSKSKLGALRARMNVGADHRPDYVFYGIGPYTQPDARSRYAARRALANASVGGAIVGVGELAMHAAVTDVDFKRSTFGDEPSIEQSVREGRIAAIPPGYASGYRAARIGGHLTLDTRFEGKRARSGARFDAIVERVNDIESTRAWTRVDLMFGGALLLDPVAERKLDVRLGVQFVHPDSEGEVPFFEMPSLTGVEWMRGLPNGRIHDVSAAALLIDYHWPLAAWLDAHAHVGAGNVYDSGLSGFSLASLRGSVGGALTLAGIGDRQIGASMAVGTEPLGQGVRFTSSRILLEYSGDY